MIWGAGAFQIWTVWLPGASAWSSHFPSHRKSPTFCSHSQAPYEKEMAASCADPLSRLNKTQRIRRVFQHCCSSPTAWISLLKATSVCLKLLKFNLSSTWQEGRRGAADMVPQIRRDPWKPNTMAAQERRLSLLRWWRSTCEARCSLGWGGDQSISHNSSADSSVNFAARSPATGLYWPSPSEMLFGVVPAVFLFFSAFLLDVFTEDESDVKTGAGPMRP